jgi:hypothetical protein
MKKQYILYHVESREIAKRKGVPIIHTGKQPPIWDRYPKNFRQSDGYRFEEIHEVCVDPAHRGQPKYVQKDSQCARFTKIIGAKIDD